MQRICEIFVQQPPANKQNCTINKVLKISKLVYLRALKKIVTNIVGRLTKSGKKKLADISFKTIQTCYGNKVSTNNNYYST